MSVPGEDGTGSACSLSRLRSASRSAGDFSGVRVEAPVGDRAVEVRGRLTDEGRVEVAPPPSREILEARRPPAETDEPGLGPPPGAAADGAGDSGVCFDSTVETGPRFSACATIAPRSLSISISACRVRNSASAARKSLPLWKRAAGSFASARARIGLNSTGIAAS